MSDLKSGRLPMKQDWTQVNHWLSQSAVTHPGLASKVLDDLPSSLSGLREVSRGLVAHYMGVTEGMSGPITGERLREVDLRYADLIFSRLLELSPTLHGNRTPDQRTAGCCRHFALLFVSMARHKGIPARVRVGYATYFHPEWYVDHVIAEVWDSKAKRWRLVEPEISDVVIAKANIDPIDVSPDQFVTGPRAWLAARSGRVDPERFVVVPDLQIPYTRSWLSLRHHIVQDLAALNKLEMLVWDQWGILNENDPLVHSDMLDQLARVTAETNCPVDELSKWSRRDGLRVPETVASYSPTQESALTVDVTRTIQSFNE